MILKLPTTEGLAIMFDLSSAVLIGLHSNDSEGITRAIIHGEEYLLGISMNEIEQRLIAKGERLIDTCVDLAQFRCSSCGGKGTSDTKTISPGPLCTVCKGKGVVYD